MHAAPGRWAVGLAAGVALLVVAACSDDDAAPATSTATTTTATPSAPTEGDTTVGPAATSTTAPTSSTATSTAVTTTTTATTTAGASYDFSAIGPIVQNFVDQRGLNGAGLVVVDRDDGVVHEQYWGAFGPDRISLIASSSKMITAGVLLRLQDEGLLDMDAPVAAVAPWGAANPTITSAQLLSNSSGLVGLLPNPGYGPYVCQYLPAGTLQDCAESIFTTAGDDADI